MELLTKITNSPAEWTPFTPPLEAKLSMNISTSRTQSSAETESEASELNLNLTVRANLPDMPWNV